MTATVSPETPDTPGLSRVPAQRPPKVRHRESASRAIFEPSLVRSACVDALRKLNPRTMALATNLRRTGSDWVCPSPKVSSTPSVPR